MPKYNFIKKEMGPFTASHLLSIWFSPVNKEMEQPIPTAQSQQKCDVIVRDKNTVLTEWNYKSISED